MTHVHISCHIHSIGRDWKVHSRIFLSGDLARSTGEKLLAVSNDLLEVRPPTIDGGAFAALPTSSLESLLSLPMTPLAQEELSRRSLAAHLNVLR